MDHRILNLAAQHSLLPRARLQRLYEIVADQMEIPGRMCQCGVWRGGAALIMAHALPKRLLWLCDSFDGLPQPGPEDGKKAHARWWGGGDRLAVDFQSVYAMFDRSEIVLNLSYNYGQFNESLPGFRPGVLAVLHIDVDWYESTRLCLEHLGRYVVPGGVIIVDDYGHWPGARQAVDEYRANGPPGRNRALHKEDETMVWWRVSR